MRNGSKRVTKISNISLSDLDLDPSDLKPHQNVEVHARYLHAKYERDRLSIEDAMINCIKRVTEKSIISLSDLDLDSSDVNPHQKVKVNARYLHAKYERDRLSIEGAMINCTKRVTEKSIISLCDRDLDPSDLKPHQKVEVHAMYLHAKYERDWLSIEGAMRNCNKSVTEESIISLSDLDLDPTDLKPHLKVKVHAR
ncbi:hypothetical protein DPMN_193206 [Dreissena polymorpha]|uniref:Uncharacterized protein n=1 Tax=Dreissena polymorpha TaxID=45954 RepID=A0A9D3Y5A5_DREPO|nr:hypothetical protein DPMN_193206 [Dreissena polymorpha]